MGEIIRDMPDTEYFAVDALSSSVLKQLAISPAHCDHYEKNGIKRTDAMLAGSALHCLVLEELHFEDRYALAPEGIDRRTKAGKAAYAEFTERSIGKDILTPEQFYMVDMCEQSIRNNKEADYYLAFGEPEVSMFWTDPLTNIKCKGRVDKLSSVNAMIDVKTTKDASPHAFSREIYSRGYHRQAAWYMDGYEECTGQRMKEFVFIVVEKTAPFVCEVYILDEESLMEGSRQNRDLIRKYQECKHTGKWPGYNNGASTISIPDWVFNKAEDDIIGEIY